MRNEGASVANRKRSVQLICPGDLDVLRSKGCMLYNVVRSKRYRSSSIGPCRWGGVRFNP